MWRGVEGLVQLDGICSSESYSGVTSVQAEARALCTGFELCSLFCIAPMMVEGDFKIIIDAMYDIGAVPPSVLPVFRRIRKLPFAGISYLHTYREGNAVADSLASIGSSSNRFLIFPMLQSLPRSIRGLCNVDRLGIGRLRFFRRPSMACI